MFAAIIYKKKKIENTIQLLLNEQKQANIALEQKKNEPNEPNGQVPVSAHTKRPTQRPILRGSDPGSSHDAAPGDCNYHHNGHY